MTIRSVLIDTFSKQIRFDLMVCLFRCVYQSVIFVSVKIILLSLIIQHSIKFFKSYLYLNRNT